MPPKKAQAPATEADNAANNAKAMQGLLDLMARLRNKDGGCPWDIAQDFKSIAPYTIEEAYEVFDAIERDNMDELKDELGDLLLQVVFHAQMASEAGLFEFAEVARSVTEKMIHRHPHVFGDEKAANAGDVEKRIWEERKDLEKKRKALDSILNDVPMALPAIMRAQKLQKRAARVGFEWARPVDVLDKMEEEIAEMREAIAGGREEEIKDELGDLFFVLTNFGRMLGADCEESLRHANSKFTRRFQGIERELKARGKSFEQSSLDEMEQIWQDEKKKEKF
jgi:MazG family protein